MATTEAPVPAALVGTFRQFGEFGPVYEVIGEAEGGDVLVVVVETGERLLYPVDQAADDPRLD